jgi:hypothetical protein
MTIRLDRRSHPLTVVLPRHEDFPPAHPSHDEQSHHSPTRFTKPIDESIRFTTGRITARS